MTDPHSEPDSLPGDGDWCWVTPILLIALWSLIGWLVWKAVA